MRGSWCAPFVRREVTNTTVKCLQTLSEKAKLWSIMSRQAVCQGVNPRPCKCLWAASQWERSRPCNCTCGDACMKVAGIRTGFQWRRLCDSFEHFVVVLDERNVWFADPLNTSNTHKILINTEIIIYLSWIPKWNEDIYCISKEREEGRGGIMSESSWQSDT